VTESCPNSLSDVLCSMSFCPSKAFPNALVLVVFKINCVLHQIACHHMCRACVLLDTRVQDGVLLPTAHSSVINQVLWLRGYRGQQPSSKREGSDAPLNTDFGVAEHLLLSSSNDDAILVYDVRSAREPWTVLRGHRRYASTASIFQADVTWGVSFCCVRL
jgi:hypothetical protein